MLALLLLIGAAAAQVSAQDQTAICGRHLIKALTSYCYAIDPLPAETATQELKFSEADGKLVGEPDLPDGFTFRARRAAEVRISSGRLIRDCCLKPCSVSELLNYC